MNIRGIEEIALNRVAMAENLAVQDNDYDRLILILSASGWNRSEISRIVGVRPQAISQTITKCKRRIDAVIS